MADLHRVGEEVHLVSRRSSRRGSSIPQSLYSAGSVIHALAAAAPVRAAVGQTIVYLVGQCHYQTIRRLQLFVTYCAKSY